ncbi:hypothetical protein NMG60_11018100 [Bertholletia excelsa]
MSGGVGLCGDIRLPKEEDQREQDHLHAKTPKPTTFRARWFTLRQLNALAVVVILSAAGMVSPEDFAFIVFSLTYTHFLSKVAFPIPPPPGDSPIAGRKNRLLGLYAFCGSVMGLYFPVAYIFDGVLEGDTEGVKAVAPQFFCMLESCFVEGVASPVMVFVPVLFNSRRVFTVVEWLRTEFSKVGGGGGYRGSLRRLYVGRGLAVVNMAFWSFNLFGFLLPLFVPRAFKEY